MVQRKQKKLTPKEAHRKAVILWQRGIASPTFHFQKRMRQRNVDMTDVEFLLENGKPLSQIKYNAEHGNFEYAVSGTDVEGEPLTLVFAFDEVFGDIFLLTVK